MKSTLILVILALACGYGMYSQYTSKEKLIADSHARTKSYEDEAKALQPGFDAAKTRYEARKAAFDDTAATMPDKEYAEAEKIQATKLAETKAALAAEEAKPVPDPPIPEAAASELAAVEKDLADLLAKSKPIETQNALMRKYKVGEVAAMPKSKAEKIK